MSKLIKMFRTNYAVSLLLISGLTIDAVYLLLCVFTDPSPLAELPVFAKIALALPLFAMILFAYQKLASIATGHDPIQQLIKLANENDKEAK